MGNDTLVAQLTMAADWDTVGGQRPHPLTAALAVLGYGGRPDAATVARAIADHGAPTSYGELRAAAGRPDTDWSTRVAACLHLLLQGEAVLAAA